MTDIEQKALALVNARMGHDLPHFTDLRDVPPFMVAEAMHAAHEAFRQEVSDAVEQHYNAAFIKPVGPLARFIIAKPDPLVEAVGECDDGTWETKAEYAQRLRAAIEKRGGKIVWGEG